MSPPTSGVGRLEARGQAASDRGEPTEKEARGDGADAADEAGAEHRGVGADQDGDRGPPANQRPGLQLETEAQVPGKLLVFEPTGPPGTVLLMCNNEQKCDTNKSIPLTCSVQYF